MCLAATENRISGKWFQFDRNFTSLTRKWFYTFILPSNYFRVTRKREREWEKEREREKKKEERVESLCSWPIAPQGKSSSLRSSKASIAEVVRRDHRDHAKHHADRDLAFVLIAIARSVDHDLAKDRASLCSFFSQFDWIWLFFFLGFVCVSVLRNKWYYIFVW